VRDLVAAALMLAGVAVQALCCIGVARMRTPLARLHFASPAGVPAVLIAAALLLREGVTQVSGRGLMLAALLAVSSPVLAHATGRAIHRRSRRS
jgi:multisubunit Na+/H+ antiporter MnhG subunit